MRRIPRIYESLESERAIRFLVEKLMPKISTSIRNSLARGSSLSLISAQEVASGDFDLYCGSLYLDEDKVWEDISVPPILKDFKEYLMYQPPFKIVIEYQRGKEGGFFNSERRGIVAYLSTDHIRSIINSIQTVSYARVVKKIQNTLEQGSFKYTLQHEMTHAYDHVISQGKFIGTKYVTPDAEGGGYTDYISQDAEINAFYASMVGELEDRGYKYLNVDFKDVVTALKWVGSLGWYLSLYKEFPKDKKKRIYSRLYQWYIEPPVGKVAQRKACELYYSFMLHSMTSTSFFYRHVPSFSDKTLKQVFQLSISNPPPSLKKLVSVDDMYQYFKDTFILIKRGKFVKGDTKVKRFEFTNDNNKNRFSFVANIIEEFESIYEGLRKSGEIWSSQGQSKEYNQYFTFIEWLYYEVGMKVKDIQKLNDFSKFVVFPFKVFLTHDRLSMLENIINPRNFRKFEEAHKLIKVGVLYDQAHSYTLQWAGAGLYVFRGSIDEFASFLQKLKAKDNQFEPRSFRGLTYKQIATEITNGTDTTIWVWEKDITRLKKGK